jgi:hypothetical protein
MVERSAIAPVSVEEAKVLHSGDRLAELVADLWSHFHLLVFLDFFMVPSSLFGLMVCLATYQQLSSGATILVQVVCAGEWQGVVILLNHIW